MLPDEDRRILTELIGKEWHTISKIRGENAWVCSCGSLFDYKVQSSAHATINNPTFTCWQDTGDLKDKIVEMGEWERFVWWCRDDPKLPLSAQSIMKRDGDKYYPAAFFNWLMDEIRFPQLVVEWWMKRGKV